jgi:mono/diheme cytochrome c family protein
LKHHDQKDGGDEQPHDMPSKELSTFEGGSFSAYLKAGALPPGIWRFAKSPEGVKTQTRAGRPFPVEVERQMKRIYQSAFLSFLLASPGPAVAVEKGLVNKGEVLVRESCSRCHAIGKEGDSPHPPAPPFRTLSSKYPVENLAESLGEGIVSGHPDMPIFVFGPHDVEAIIEYLKSIQSKQP